VSTGPAVALTGIAHPGAVLPSLGVDDVENYTDVIHIAGV
jgi:hypothetical protein